jgi:hypothetical protein
MAKQQLAELALVLLFAANAFAGVIPGRWEKVDSLKNGYDIIVVLKSGDRIFADFRGSDAESLLIKPSGESERRILKADVRQIESDGIKQDGALNGAVLGAAAGAGLGALLGAVAGEDEYRDAKAWAGLVFGAAIGFGVGYGVDSSSGKPVLLYQAVD